MTLCIHKFIRKLICIHNIYYSITHLFNITCEKNYNCLHRRQIKEIPIYKVTTTLPVPIY